MLNFHVLFALDGYKLGHVFQYPQNTTQVYSNLTARGKINDESPFNGTVFFGLQAYLYRLQDFFEDFFAMPLDIVLHDYDEFCFRYLGSPAKSLSHIESLHRLQYLPLEIRALPEGTFVPYGVPMLTIYNTHPDHAWLVNALETSLSANLWQPITSATTAYYFRRQLEEFAADTGGSQEFIDFQGHDFSYRGMTGDLQAAASGAGHLLSFFGSDTIPAGFFVEYNYYEWPTILSVPACYSEDTELLTNKGFVRFSDLTTDDLVAQYHPDGTVDFVAPTAYYADRYTGPMSRIYSNGKHRYYDVLVTPNHKIVSRSLKGDIKLKEAGVEGQDQMPIHTNNTMIVSGFGTGSVTALTPFERFLIAFQADGSLSQRPHQYTGHRTGTVPIRFSLKKDRKADRLRDILADCDFEFTESKYKNGYYSFRVQVPLGFTLSKSLDWIDLKDKHSTWAQEFVEELAHWDGTRPRPHLISYASADGFSAEQVQAVCAIAGYKSHYSEHIDPRGDRKPQHIVLISTDKNEVSAADPQREMVDYDGTVYCVSVPTKMIVVKHADRVLVCGNTEHSVMCVGTATDGEFETFKRLITETYPSGIVSIVSDTFDLWEVLTDFMPRLKDTILARNGKVVIRPDSGDPVDIVCGDPSAAPGSPEYKGVLQLLAETFGTTTNAQGFKTLNPNVGVIYGDSITLARLKTFRKRMTNEGWASDNMVFGIGSYTYQYVTRDTHRMAVKSTAAVVNGVQHDIFKDPKTDHKKRSARGYLNVTGTPENPVLEQQQSSPNLPGLLRTVFHEGEFLNHEEWSTVRNRLHDTHWNI